MTKLLGKLEDRTALTTILGEIIPNLGRYTSSQLLSHTFIEYIKRNTELNICDGISTDSNHSWIYHTKISFNDNISDSGWAQLNLYDVRKNKDRIN
ncbi:MAG: hypothetical protein MPL62_05935 [Alphaproteobacteria bacterium]|nr:hypothetical protein [Alphaproteobacteria bacterium]